MSGRYIIRFASVAALLLGASLPAKVWAGEAGDKNKKRLFNGVALQMENDMFYGTDRDYTGGMRLSFISPEYDDAHKSVQRLFNWVVKPIRGTTDDTRLGLALGLQVYTPKDKTSIDLIDDDRPYAGWLYLAGSMHSETEKTSTSSTRRLDSVELRVGVVGPHAFGKEAQDLVHDTRLFDRFEGWGNQLKDEPGVMLSFEHKWRRQKGDHCPGGWGYDVVPRVGASIGNVLTHANIGANFRYGFNVPCDYGPSDLIEKSLPFSLGERSADWSLYAFAGAEGRIVARNIFLDGNTFANSHSVDKEPLVADLSYGVAWEYRGFRLAYNSVFRSREFEGQDRYTSFGSVSATYQF